jgi:homoserine kinase type II
MSPDPEPRTAPPESPAAVSGSASWPTLAPSASAPSDSSTPSGASSAPARPAHARASFEAGELAVVCSRYDVGVIESVREFRRGSGKAPKVVLKTDRGRFLLKRRTVGRDTAGRVAFTHAIQIHLAQRRFPLPRLINTRVDHNSMLILGEQIYELFEFIAGDNYDGSLDATADAGRALAFFHRLLGNFQPHAYSPPSGSYHNARVDEHLASIGQRLSDPQTQASLRRLRAAYQGAAQRVEALGFPAWPLQIIHGDWHPGNMLFKGSRVAAVIDYDTARRAPRIIDIANGVLQFSISMKSGDPDHWPAGLDEGRLKRFCRGYESVKDCVISTAELEALPWLMTEALIVEAAIPIAMTGSFAGLSGEAFLRMVDGKVSWLQEHAPRLTSLVSE